MDSFDTWLTKAMDREGLTPQDAAKALGVSLSRYYQIRTRAFATPYTAWKIEKLLGMRVPVELVRAR